MGTTGLEFPIEKRLHLIEMEMNVSVALWSIACPRAFVRSGSLHGISASHSIVVIIFIAYDCVLLTSLHEPSFHTDQMGWDIQLLVVR